MVGDGIKIAPSYDSPYGFWEILVIPSKDINFSKKLFFSDDLILKMYSLSSLNCIFWLLYSAFKIISLKSNMEFISTCDFTK